MNDNPSTPRRRWFRFGRRTMFVVFVLCAALFGIRADVLSTRRAMVAQILERGGLVDAQSPHFREGGDYHTATADRRDRLPFWWSLLGVRPIRLIAVPIGEFSEEERQQIKTVFPEIGSGLRLPSDPKN
jgi:hypothetical protein